MIEERTERETVVRMVEGEDLIAGLTDLPIESAILVCGIGMLREIELGYRTGERYQRHRFGPPVELASLQGTVARFGEERVVHLHVCVAQRDGSTLGGHPFAGTIHNTAEIALSLLRGIILERRREETGLTGLHPRLRLTAEDAG